ncbi:MAG: flagellar export chaperone FliS [Dehalococcoidia bacterium]|nr:flagellar export chaperone FliS [Dehalococcoidia bacterium]NUQ55708.1 flagellar export chaperone FliS [Dehalococcoidia bacterium]
MTTNAVDAYKTQGILTADPVTLTTMLYDGALKAIRKARLQHESGNTAGFAEQVERGSLIIGELLATLDMNQGELPRSLSGIYSYCLRMLLESTLGNLSGLDEAEKHIARIAESWKAAVASLRTSDGPALTGEAAA